MTKICVTGPESSGKTTLCRELSQEFGAKLILEYALEYLSNYGPEYNKKDLLNIAKGQKKAINQACGDIIICDTGLEVIQIWSKWKYGSCDPWIVNHVEQSEFDLYLLCRPDIPWIDGPYRENPSDRKILFDLYFELLNSLDKPFIIIEGSGEKRVQRAIEKIKELDLT